ncbi:G-type lectin S-receptor-like serine/threonine-protein kinase LECRK3 [Tanacetum coccineum]
MGSRDPPGHPLVPSLPIWYDKIPEKTIIWYPQGNSMVSRGSKVELLDGSGLVLTDPQGTRVWSSISVSNLAYGFMNDTGNFVLVGSDSHSIWESFDSFADTMLPTQVMARGGVINSKLSDTNFTGGRFQLRLLQDGNLVLNSRDIASGLLYILKRNGKRSELTLKMPFLLEIIIIELLLVLMVVCSLNGARRPNCECPPGLSLINSRDPYGVCKLNFTPSYEEELIYSGYIDFVELTSIDWPQSDYAHMESTSVDECKDSYMND